MGQYVVLTLRLSLSLSLRVSVSALAMTGTTLTLLWMAFMNCTSRGFKLDRKQAIEGRVRGAKVRTARDTKAADLAFSVQF